MKRARHSAFTLTEIVLALAIIATAFVAILGLLPAGLDASRQAANATIVASILNDLHHRVQHHPLQHGEVAFSPAFYDDRGSFIPADATPEEKARRHYRADVRISEWQTRPAHTSELRTIGFELSWPVQPATGEALGLDNPKKVVTYPATTLTGPDWTLIYPSGRRDLQYQAKVEF